MKNCTCQNTHLKGQTAGCKCNIWVHPEPLDIIAGLNHIPRQIATFPDFRQAMLAKVREESALSNWRAREEDDLGIMLFEMWAYICDSLSFYDEVISQETYLRTARLRPSVRKLVDLLGYFPRPAVAASARLVAIGAGRRLVKLPARTAFRSGAFEGELPQIFELQNDTMIHPLMNHWKVSADKTKKKLSSSDNIILTPEPEKPVEGHSSALFSLKDKNEIGIEVVGELNFPNAQLNLEANQNWDSSLTLPVEVYGNIIEVSRGESVIREILGSGDAALAIQSFKLQKNPLTYLNAPTADNGAGIKNTLTIHVNGIRWKEVNNFYGKTEEEQIYIVRQNDEGESSVIFGDGIRGQRLPNGQDNILATYRFGAGKASPPANELNQISKPVKNLQSVFNPLAAFGGADAESIDEVRTYAPQSVLILGRAISIKDMEAVAFSVPGVRGVQSMWAWSPQKQKAVAKIWFIGENNIESLVIQRLRSLSDPTTSIEVEQAIGVSSRLSIDVSIDNRYFEKDVINNIRHQLTNIKTGILAIENIGIGAPLFRSQIFDTALEVEGTISISGISWYNNIFSTYAKTPGKGRYFDFEKGQLFINGNDTYL